ncbi:type III restriction enzyme [Hespellia stercorisuis DSM 15480]|uniref:Type III restriction enzyme n=1 Tax=Hespellia stercorisuis DSM 15480 TaxID=1121950 RepID=A0A1M6WE09_9FIRM|nr:type III restriction enzyme [Hespellia stercorisuis DSM 15480]
MINHVGLDENDAAEKVLVVTSAAKHKINLPKLGTVDSKENSAEWIFSVSMLTEGWDVKNVFQIVPWEDRAFNSKLLIAQVLGRGLRIPEELRVQPKVRVYNHASWSKKIQSLVDEILEMELTLTSKNVDIPEREKYNFSLYSIDYTREERVSDKKEGAQQEVFDLTKGMKLVSQLEEEEQETEYEDIKGNISLKKTIVKKETVSIDEVVRKISESFKGRALEAKLVFTNGEYENEKLPPISEIKSFIRSSMDECGINGDLLTQENANKIYGKFTGLLRRKPSTPVFNKKVNDLIEIETSAMRSQTERYSVIKQYLTLFMSSAYKKEMDEDEQIVFEKIKDEVKGRQVQEINRYCYKTPVNMVFATLEPERKFISMLTSDELSPHIDAWVKARDTGFYTIDYQKNKGSKFKGFNPDFFVKVGDAVLVIEIKADGDISEENKAKYKAAKRHFELLNLELQNKGIKQRYYFDFLSPVDYKTYMKYVIDGRIFSSNYRSSIEDALEKYEN